MSVDRWVSLMTVEQKKDADSRAGYGECWFHALGVKALDIGDGKDSNGDELRDMSGEPLLSVKPELLRILSESSAFDKDKTAEVINAVNDPLVMVWYHAE